MMYFFILFLPSFLFAQIELDSIDVFESSVSDDVLGFSSEKGPISSQSYRSEMMEKERIKTSNDLTLIDSSITNSYSGSGYWDSLNIRGFAVDNRTNYFRDGLRINAQTAIPLESKESVEVIKGLGAFQNSGSSPSGSINYRVKRPKNIRLFRNEFTERGGVLSHLDYGSKKDKLEYRFNLLNEKIKSGFSNNDGHRNLLASAFSFQLNEKSLLEAEVEWSRRSQVSLGAQSFWNNSRPGINPQLNLNSQEWSKPVEFESLFYSLRYSQELSDKWFLSVIAGRQYSVTDDRMSYGFGCTAESNWSSFCSDGSFDVYDYRSENERRITNSSKVSLSTKIDGRVDQEISFNLRYTHQLERSGFQAYNFVGVGDQSGRALPANPSKTDPTTNLNEETLEFFIVDQLKFNEWSLWLGGNFQHKYRSTWKNNDTEKNKSNNDFFTPWLALARQINEYSLYLSYSQAKESWITPNKADYNNPAAILPEQTTHQYELGIKSKIFSTAIFYLKRPRLFDDGSVFKIEGDYQQYGLETNSFFKFKESTHQLSLMYLRVEQNGKSAPNIPDLSLRYVAQVSWKNMIFGSRMQYESMRYSSYDNELSIPDWIKWDFFVERKFKDLNLRLYVDNLFQKSFWKESPVQYGHHYLFPGQSRRLGILAEYQF